MSSQTWLPGALITTLAEHRLKGTYSADLFLCLQSGPSASRVGEEQCQRVWFLDVETALIGACKLRPSHWAAL